VQANDPRRPDPRRDACEELAELLAGEDAQRTVRLLQHTKTLLPTSGDSPTAEASAAGPPRAPQAPAPLPISIWQPRQQDGEWIFERPAPLPLGDHHAGRRRFCQHKPPETTRICLFGESVAAGYLYAPRLTPAMVLAAQLAHFAPTSAFEVVDLARTNERLDTLVETAERSLQLAPDRWVIFVGNNWNLLETAEVSPYFPSLEARQHYAQALRKRNLDGAVDLAAERLEERTRNALSRLARLATGAKIEVVLVIPESHLAGWEVAQPVPWLAGDGTARWHILAEETRKHLLAGRATEAVEAAEELLALDGGRCPTGHRLLTRARLALGQVDAARQASQEAVDRSAYATLGFLGSPQATSAVQDQLRSAATKHGFATVDLPWIFAAQDEEQLPGDEFFLDYCHLTGEGMRLAMAAVSHRLLVLDGHPMDLEETLLNAPPPVLTRQAAATAHLGAAVHGAHRRIPVLEDDSEPLAHHLHRALEIDPSISQTFLDLAAARCAPIPEALTAAQGRNLSSPHRLLLQHGWRWDHLDIELLQTMCEVLEEAGRPARHLVQSWLLRHHSVEHRPRDLCRAPYLWQPLERLYPEVMDTEASRRATFRAAWPWSRFCLITSGARDVFLEPVLRLPIIPGSAPCREGAVTVRINGEAIVSLPADSSWSRGAFRLPQESLQPVINQITLEWPGLPAAGDEAFSEAVRQLEMGREVDLHPIFGEVYSLVARVSCYGAPVAGHHRGALRGRSAT